MPVYIIQAGEHGPCKIGFSRNIASRLSKMQADNHERLTVLRIFDGGAAEELELHQRFAENWLHGEWHSFSNAMLGDLGLVEILEMTQQEVQAPAAPRSLPTTMHWRPRPPALVSWAAEYRAKMCTRDKPCADCLAKRPPFWSQAAE